MSNQFRRSFNRDGSSNILRTGVYSRWYEDISHKLLSASWPQFLLILALGYFSVNLFFGAIYFMMGPEGLAGIKNREGLGFFLECFFFSVQTFSTIGYGQVHPSGILDNVVVSFQALTGLISVGVMSGLFFSRFVRPTSKVKFSEIALITNYLGKRSLIFRLANARFNQIVEAQITANFTYDAVTPEGETLRRWSEIKLVRSRSPLFVLSWLVIHEIDADSPLFNKSIEDLKKMNAEVFVSVTGHDVSFSGTVHARFSYIPDEIVMDKQFADLIQRQNGKIKINLDVISDTK